MRTHGHTVRSPEPLLSLPTETSPDAWSSSSYPRPHYHSAGHTLPSDPSQQYPSYMASMLRRLLLPVHRRLNLARLLPAPLQVLRPVRRLRRSPRTTCAWPSTCDSRRWTSRTSSTTPPSSRHSAPSTSPPSPLPPVWAPTARASLATRLEAPWCRPSCTSHPRPPSPETRS